MTDREKGDHWGQLASILGAEIHEEASADELPPGSTGAAQARMENEVPVGETAPIPRAEVERPRRPRPSANWDALAKSLGIEVPAEPVIIESAEIVSADRPKERFAERDEEQIAWKAPEPLMSTEQLAETVAGLSECVKTAPVGLEHEPMVFIAHETVAIDLGEEDAEEADRSSGDEEPARGRSKRRRRRRPRTGERQFAPEDADAASSDAVEVTDETGEEDEAAAPASDEKRRSKRRRPRRRRQKSDPSDAKASPKVDVEDGGNGEADSEDDDDVDDTRDGADGDAFGDKAGHRSIPVWQEAIGVIIERNLESRAKKPDGGGQQKRGGRRSSRRGRG